MHRALEDNVETNVESTRLVNGSSRDPGNEHVVIGRLIRRLRVSESPDRFHFLAANVLRSSLGVESVAWVPRDAGEPVVVASPFSRMEPRDYRSLTPSPAQVEPSMADDVSPAPRPRGLPDSVGRFLVVAAGPAGWLVAVNTPEDRPFTPAEIERVHYVASLIDTQLANARIYTELKGLLFGIIRALTAAIDAKDPYTSGHSERVARIAVRLAEELAVPRRAAATCISPGSCTTWARLASRTAS